MSWGSWDNFIAMGGYAFYVWGSYLVTLGLIIAEVTLLRVRKRATLGRFRPGGTPGKGER